MLRKEEILSLLKPAIISDRPYLPADAASATPAAVLVIIHYHKEEDSPHVFLTKRSSNLKSHRGEISFPGGRYIESDGTLLATALRETEEEVGIAFTPEQVAGSLRAVHTMTSNHFIVPFVTVQDILPKYRTAASEVEAVIDVPLIETLRSIEPDTEHYGLAQDAFKFTYGNNVIWGATARILKQLHGLLIDR
ncbi:putative NUDIX hydrolase [Candidatus Nitrososphaera gargensis Ga9.2]|uniref:Putative NUDIX hydrolase n=1 Tax=Nitrososphaera gargensis (strain Ga9.2) TaxID=1237085 RepID=K0IHU4_NITGG|nr:putative NUDIX hydrolase [Candidatus Nitrososphaera gargensis Ga9.2]